MQLLIHQFLLILKKEILSEISENRLGSNRYEYIFVGFSSSILIFIQVLHFHECKFRCE